MANSRDYSDIINKLRAKADKTDSKEERDVINAKVKELEDKYGKAPTRMTAEEFAELFVKTNSPWQKPNDPDGDSFIEEMYDDLVEEGYQYDNPNSDW